MSVIGVAIIGCGCEWPVMSPRVMGEVWHIMRMS